MQTNTNSISAWVDVDHYGFKNASNLGGLHTQVTMPALLNIPARLLTTSGILYVKDALVFNPPGPPAPQNAKTLFYTAGTSGKEYQLTRTINNNTQFALFGQNVIGYTPPVGDVTSQNGGWTFLPGGLLLQYGFCNILMAGSGSVFDVVFPIPFSVGVNPYSITTSVTRISLAVPMPVVAIIDGTVSPTGFQANINRISGTTTPYSNSIAWMAIGI
jgi:hypothetical protein